MMHDCHALHKIPPPVQQELLLCPFSSGSYSIIETVISDTDNISSHQLWQKWYPNIQPQYFRNGRLKTINQHLIWIFIMSSFQHASTLQIIVWECFPKLFQITCNYGITFLKNLISYTKTKLWKQNKPTFKSTNWS